MRRRVATATLLAALVAALAGCGEEDEAAPGAAAEAVPADAVFLLETVVRPEGEQREAIEALAARFLGEQDPGEKIVELLNEEAAEEDSELTWEEDIEPWLGERGALFFTDFEGFNDEDEEIAGSSESAAFEQHGAFVVETTDPERAREFLEQAANEDEVEESRAEYEGYEYLVDEEGTAGGVIGDVLVFGNEDALEAVVDTIEGADGLLEDESFTAELDEDEREAALASLYVDVERAIEVSGGTEALEGEEGEAVRELFPELLATPVVATASASETGVAIDVSFGSLGALGGLPAPGEEVPLLAELPGDAWAAAASSDLGESYIELFDAARATQSTQGTEAEFDQSQIEALEQVLGIDLERALGALGDAALYVRGTSLLELEGAAVIENLDPAASRDLIAALERGIRSERAVAVQPASIEGAEGIAIQSPEVPQPINVVADEERIVIGYGSEATIDSLAPADPLLENETYASARDLLGDELPLALLVDVDPLLELLDASPVASSPELAAARPYLDPIGFLAVGGSDDGELTRYRFVLETD